MSETIAEPSPNETEEQSPHIEPVEPQRQGEQGAPAAPPSTAPVEDDDKKEEEPKDLAEILVPKREHKAWIFEDKREVFNQETGEPHIQVVWRQRYVQRPLSYFGKLDFLKLISGTVRDLMNGPDGVSVGQLMDMIGGADTIQRLADPERDKEEATIIAQSFTRLGLEAPELVLDAYMIFLAVPRDEREQVREIMQRPVELGGLTDEDGIEILEIFVDQNVEVVRDFFARLAKLGRRAGQRLNEREER